MSKSRRLIILGSLFFASLLLRFFVPPYALYGASHDDELMVRMATNIANGVWLGDYSDFGHLLLAKPPGYPIFLGFTSWLPWAPTVSVHLLLIIGIYLVMRELFLAGINEKTVIISAAIYLFHPSIYNESFSRIYREGFLTSLTWIILACLLYFVRFIRESSVKKNLTEKTRVRVSITALSFGLVLGIYMITKPSWYHLVVLILGFSVVSLKTIPDYRRDVLKRTLTGLILTFLGVMAVNGTVLYLNHAKFDVRLIDSYSQGEFPELLNTIVSVKDNDIRPYVLVSKNMRTSIYEVSSTFKKLESYLELEDGTGWRSASCNSPIQICDETTAWFPWELRDAIEQAGLGDTPAAFESNTRRIRTEIEKACAQELLDCGSSGIAPGVGQLSNISKRSFIDAYGSAVQHLLNTDLGYEHRNYQTEIAQTSLDRWQGFINGLAPTKMDTTYETDDIALGDIRLAISDVYQIIWPVFLLFGLIGVMIGSRVNLTLFYIYLCLIVAIVIFVSQLALLQASSGEYMVGGGKLYLLPLFPLIWMACVLGLNQIIENLRQYLGIRTLVRDMTNELDS